MHYLKRGTFFAFLFYNISLVYLKIEINITITSSDININNFQKILNSYFKCENYSMKAIPYNETEPFQPPSDKNNLSSIQFVFGPLQYFNPAYFDFKADQNISLKLKSMHILGLFMEMELRIKLMIKAVMNVTQNDDIKKAVFIFNGSYIDPKEPWKKFNPMPYLSSFKGLLNVFGYSQAEDANRICTLIYESRIVTIAVNLRKSDTLTLLKACNDSNLLNWQIRWLVFFTSFSYLNPSDFQYSQIRENFTIFDFPKLNEKFSLDNIEEQEVVLSDIAKLMSSSLCDTDQPSTIDLTTGQFEMIDHKLTRKNWKMNIYRYRNNFTQVGNVVITFDNGVANINMNLNQLENFNSSYENILKELQKKPIRLSAMIEKPFVYFENGNLTGFSYEMITYILKNISVPFNITLFYNATDGRLTDDDSLNGMLGVVQKGIADLIIGPITQNNMYSTFVDFTYPFMEYNVAIIYKKNITNIFSEIFEFIFVFDYVVWAIILGSCVIYAIALTVLNIISPNEARFGFVYSFLFTMGSMVQGVTTALPDKISGKVLVVFWWIFNIAVVLVYVACYGAFRTIHRLQATINQLSDLTNPISYQFGTINGSAIDNFLQTSSSADIQLINQIIRNQFASILPTSFDMAMSKVRNNGFAFIYIDKILNLYANETCIIVTNGENTFNMSYALPLNSEYTNVINMGIQNFLKSDFRTSLVNKYFPTGTEITCRASYWLDTVLEKLDTQFLPSGPFALKMNEFSGIFVIMIFGIIIALICALIELIVRKCKKKKTS